MRTERSPGWNPCGRLAAVVAMGLAIAMAGCFRSPVERSLELIFGAEGGVRAVFVTRLDWPAAGDADTGPSARARKRLEQLAQQIERGDDSWSREVARLEPARERIASEREAGRLVLAERSVDLVDPRDLAPVFAASGVDYAFGVVGGTATLTLRPGSSRRATGRDRAAYQASIGPWLQAAGAYVAALRALYGYLEVEPSRARACLGPLVADVLDDDVKESLPELREEEQSLVDAVNEAMNALASVFRAQEASDEGYSLDEISNLVHDPFPAPLTIRLPRAPLEVTGFEAGEGGTLVVGGTSLWSAWLAVAAKVVEPDPLREVVTRFRATVGEPAPLDLDNFAALPRFAEAVDARALGERIALRLEPAPLYQVSWVMAESSE